MPLRSFTSVHVGASSATAPSPAIFPVSEPRQRSHSLGTGVLVLRLLLRGGGRGASAVSLAEAGAGTVPAGCTAGAFRRISRKRAERSIAEVSGLVLGWADFSSPNLRCRLWRAFAVFGWNPWLDLGCQVPV